MHDKYKSLPRRLYSSLILSFWFLFAVIGGKYTTLILCLWLFGHACREFLNMAHLAGINPINRLTVMAALICICAGTFSKSVMDFSLVCCTMILALVHLYRVSSNQYSYHFADFSTTVFTVIYSGWLPAHFVLLRQLHNGDIYSDQFWKQLFMHGNFSWHNLTLIFSEAGIYYCLITAFSIFVNDICAYFAGKTFGKHAFTPISPAKTSEGAIAGLIGGTISFAILGLGTSNFFSLTYSLYSWLDWIIFLIMGLLLSILAQAGDLIESFFKRSAGVKDSGHLIPGQGGILDRFDSHILVLVIAYYFFAVYH